MIWYTVLINPGIGDDFDGNNHHTLEQWELIELLPEILVSAHI